MLQGNRRFFIGPKRRLIASPVTPMVGSAWPNDFWMWRRGRASRPPRGHICFPLRTGGGQRKRAEGGRAGRRKPEAERETERSAAAGHVPARRYQILSNAEQILSGNFS